MIRSFRPYRQALRLLAPLAFAALAQAYIRLNINYNGGAVAIKRSDATAIQFYINNKIGPNFVSTASGPSVTVISAGSDPVAATRAALASWNAVPGSTARFLPLKPTDKVNDPADGQMTIAVGSAADASAIGGALAITLTQSTTFPVGSAPSGDLFDSDIILNPGVQFSTDGSTNTDLQGVMTHELGHALGSNHSGLVGATMYQFASPAARYLSQDEITFASAVYPAPTAKLGTVNGKVLASDGTPVQEGLVELIDPSSGAALSALTAADGTYSLQMPPGSYVIYAEPMAPNGVFYLPAGTKVTTNFQATVLGGAATPTKVAVSASNVTSAPDLVVTSGAGALQFPFLTTGTAGVDGNVAGNPAAAALFVSSGKAIDLVLAGGGVDGTITVQAFGQGVSVRQGGVKVDSKLNLGGQPVVRVTVDVSAVAYPALTSLFITKGTSTFVVSGAFVVVPPKPSFIAAGVDSAASGKWVGGVSPGGYTAIYFSGATPNLGPPNGLLINGYDAYGTIPGYFSGVSVTFDGIPAPLFYVSASQINLQVPFELAGKLSTQAVVNYLGSASDPVTVPVLPAQPAFFMVNATDPFAANSDYATNPKINSVTNPAARGTVISVYGTGVGKVSYNVPTGAPATAPTPGFTGGYTCTLGGVPFAVAFAGWTPTATALAQWSFVIPGDSPGGAVTLTCTDTAKGVTTQTATVYIR